MELTLIWSSALQVASWTSPGVNLHTEQEVSINYCWVWLKKPNKHKQNSKSETKTKYQNHKTKTKNQIIILWYSEYMAEKEEAVSELILELIPGIT